MVDLKREEAQAIGFGSGVAYDALLDDYEPGATTADARQAADRARERVANSALPNDATVTISVVIAERSAGESRTQLLARADDLAKAETHRVMADDVGGLRCVAGVDVAR